MERIRLLGILHYTVKRWPLLLMFLLSVCLIFPLTACDDNDDDAADAGDDDATPPDDDDDDDDNDDTSESLRIDRATLEDKIIGSWVGQMAGVTWAASTEFHYCGRIIPADEVPEWRPAMINNGFIQDDLYVEIPFLEVLTEQGVITGWAAFGEAFRDTVFPLWHANKAARDNLRHGVPAPASGHYSVNEHCDDIDWQIEADFIGSICPGLVNEAIDMSWRAGHVMNYGDGVLGGVFVSAMHAAAFFAADVSEIIEAGRLSLPVGSEYRTVIEDAIGWCADGKTWEENWQLLQEKWGLDDRCPDFTHFPTKAKNIDAKLNGAYILLGLLYGEGDLEESMRIAMRCGQDSDCNPSSVGGILGNWLGVSGIPEKYKSALRPDTSFLFTDYSLREAVAAQLDQAEQVLTMAGASVEGEGRIWTIPASAEILPPILEQWPNEANDLPVLTARLVSQDGAHVRCEANASDADGILDYEWYFGDLRRARGAAVEHAYAAPGTYEIIVIVADGIGNTAWQSLSVAVP